MSKELLRRLRGLLKKDELERELDEELRFHLEKQIEQNVERGMKPAEARRRALISFGGVEAVKEDCRQVRGTRLVEELWQDLRYGARMLFKRPGFTLVALVALTLGIGANTAIFSVVNAVILRPLPFEHPEQLVLVKENLPKLGWYQLSASPAEFLDYRQGNEVFSETAAFTDLSVNLTGAGEPQRIQAARVSASLFPLLGVSPLRGRTFSVDEDEPGRADVVVLSYKLWQRHFGADAHVIGRVVRLDDKPYTVVGVMPKAFTFPYNWTSFADEAELWMPLAMTAEEKKNRANSFDYGVIGRMKQGVTIRQAQANIEAIANRFTEQHPEIYNGNVQVTASVVSLEQDVVKNVRPFLLILLGAVCMVLLIACANVANLLLARATARQKEIVIRRAMGAGTFRVVRQLLTESLLLALVGGVCGLLLAAWAVGLIAAFGPQNVPRLAEANLDTTVLLFTLVISLLTGIIFGLAPARQSARLNLNEILKETGGRAGAGSEGKRLRGLLVIFETAAALILLVGAGLLINSFLRILSVPPGFDPQGVVIAQTAMPATRYTEATRTKAAQRELLERLAAIPGVQAAAVTTNLPLAGDRTIGFLIEGHNESEVNTAYNAWVSNDYFRAMGISLTSGRPFTDEDRETSPPVVIINETMARHFWPQGDAIGKRIMWGGWKNRWLTIVGIVADVKVYTLEAEATPAIYMPIFQIPRARESVIYVLRSSTDAAAIAAAMRKEIKSVDEELPVYNIRTMRQVMGDSVAQRRFNMLLLAVFAATALLLAAIGLYGVLSYSVERRTHEIGIRMALGARESDVLKLVIGQGLKLASAGAGLGIVISLVLTRLLSSLLFGVKAHDPLTFAVITLVLMSAAVLACYIPARRATRVDPLVALRYE